MAEKRGIPKDILDELDIHKKREKKPREVTIVVEEHQAKIPIPKNVRLRLNLKKGAKCLLTYYEDKKELVCKFK